MSIIALTPGLALSFLDQSILPVALPIIQEQLGASDVALQWSVNSYLLAIGIFVLVGGKISDRYGHRFAFGLGLALFCLFSALCGVSPNIETLIAARFLQGIGAALMFPSQTGLMAQCFSPSERGRATGLSVTIGSIFLILGPVVGGLLTEALSWRWIFYINPPIGLIGLILLYYYISRSPQGKGKIDFLGFFYFAIGASALVVYFMQAPSWGWLTSHSLLCLLAAVLFLSLLIHREKRAAHPFLDLSLFKHPLYSAITINIFITQFILMISVFRTIYLETTLQFSPAFAGLITSISSAPILFLAFLGGYLSDKFSPKLPIALGYLLIIGSFFSLGFFSMPSLPVLFISLLSFGMGIPLIFTPSYSAAMFAVPSHKFGVAFGLISTLRNLGATVGLALISLFVNLIQSFTSPKLGTEKAQVESFSAIHFTLGFLMILAFAIAFIFHNRKSAHHPPASSAEGWD